MPGHPVGFISPISGPTPRVYPEWGVSFDHKPHYVMHLPLNSNSPSPPAPRGVTTTRAERGLGNNTAQPPLTSGFGAVIEKERDLQAATRRAFGQVNRHHAHDVDRILRHQQSRLGANISLLEQRYEALPKPERFASWNERLHPTNTLLGLEDRENSQVLPELVARHAGLQADIETLIELAPDGQRGELILGEVSRNHEEMAWMLTALLKEDATSAGVTDHDGDGTPNSLNQAEENWDNEGGLPGPVLGQLDPPKPCAAPASK